MSKLLSAIEVYIPHSKYSSCCQSCQYNENVEKASREMMNCTFFSIIPSSALSFSLSLPRMTTTRSCFCLLVGVIESIDFSLKNELLLLSLSSDHVSRQSSRPDNHRRWCPSPATMDDRRSSSNAKDRRSWSRMDCTQRARLGNRSAAFVSLFSVFVGTCLFFSIPF
jgi:hypothetical protein